MRARPPCPISSVALYDDYTYMAKRPDGYRDSQQNVLGATDAAWNTRFNVNIGYYF